MISDHLSKAERLACIKAGALSYAGYMDAEYGAIPETKTAGVIDTVNTSANAAKTIAIISALTAGIPLGVFGHVMGRRINGKRLREEELKEKIRMYQDAANEMASGLGGND